MQITSVACDNHAVRPLPQYRVIDRVPAAGIDRWRVCEVRGCGHWSTQVVTSTDEPEYTYQEGDALAFLIGAGIAALVVGGVAAAESAAERRRNKKAKQAKK